MPVLQTTRFRSARIKPATAVVMIVLAAVAWGGALLWQARRSPAERHVAAGREWALAGNAKRAEREWREAVRLQPDNAAAWEALGELYLSTENWAPGAESLKRLAELRPGARGIQGRLAICLLRSGDELAALEAARAELRRNPNDVAALTIAALLSSNLGEFQKEAEYLNRLLALNPHNLPLLTLIAENLTFTHKYDEAQKVIARILKLAPGHAEAYALRGACTLNTDVSAAGLARAEQDFRESLKRNPFAPFARLSLARVHLRRKEPEKAVFQLEQAKRIVPNKMDVWFELGRAYELAGKPEAAETARRRFQQIRALVDRRNSLLKKCAVDPSSFDHSLELGLLALNEGDYRMARTFLTRAQSLRPKDERAQRALERLARLTGEETDPKQSLAAGVPGLAPQSP